MHYSALSTELQDHKPAVLAGLEPATSRTRIEVAVLCNAACSMKRCSVPAFIVNAGFAVMSQMDQQRKRSFTLLPIELRNGKPYSGGSRTRILRVTVDAAALFNAICHLFVIGISLPVFECTAFCNTLFFDLLCSGRKLIATGTSPSIFRRKFTRYTCRFHALSVR